MIVNLGVPPGTTQRPVSVACDMMTVMSHRSNLYAAMYNDWLERLDTLRHPDTVAASVNAPTMQNIAQRFFEWMATPNEPAKFLTTLLKSDPMARGSQTVAWTYSVPREYANQLINRAFESFDDVDWLFECVPLTTQGPVPIESFEPVASFDTMYEIAKHSHSLPMVFKMSLTKQYN